MAPEVSTKQNPRGFDAAHIIAFLERNAAAIEKARLPDTHGISVQGLAANTAATLRELASDVRSKKLLPQLEKLELHLTVLEEKLFSGLLASTPDEQLVSVRAQADRELAPISKKDASLAD